MRADEGRDVGAGMISMTGVEYEVDERGIGLRIESFNFADLRLKLPPMVVIGNADANALREAACNIQSIDFALELVGVGGWSAAEDEVLRTQRSSSASDRLVERGRGDPGAGIVHF